MMNDDLLHTAIYMHKSQETPPPPPKESSCDCIHVWYCVPKRQIVTL